MNEVPNTITEIEPELLLVDEAVYRMRERQGEGYTQYIQGLANSIQAHGQLQEAIVRQTEDGLMLVAGQCRREAVELLREQGVELKLRCRVLAPLNGGGNDPEEDNRAFQLAGEENLRRRNFKPLEVARLFVATRERFGGMATKGVAQFWGVSRATVTQHEKLLAAPEDVKAALADGRMTAEGALELLKIGDEDRGKVLEEAAAEAEAEERNKNAKAAKGKGKGKSEAGKGKETPLEALQSEPGGVEGGREVVGGPESAAEAPGTPQEAGKAKGRVTARHVKKAAKKQAAKTAKDGTAAPRMYEVKDFFLEFTGPALHVLVREFCEAALAWTKGEAGLKKVERALWAVNDWLPAQKKPPASAKEAIPPKAPKAGGGAKAPKKAAKAAKAAKKK